MECAEDKIRQASFYEVSFTPTLCLMRFKVYERARLPADDDMMIVRWCCDKEDENGNVVDA